MSNFEHWERYKKYLYYNPELDLMLDISKMNFPESYFESMKIKMQKAFEAMEALEGGAIANPDEERTVGHYWLRSPQLAPTEEMTREIEKNIDQIKKFAAKIHNGEILSSRGTVFQNILLIGIGGSALGPQFVSDALGTNENKMQIYFLDNTDPDGFDRVLDNIKDQLAETLVIVISKSGGTKETRNGMLEVQSIFQTIGLKFVQHAVAITQVGSNLDQIALKNNWLARFPLWNWVGGRTSETSSVGLLPAALQGIDIDSLLKGATICDKITRNKDVSTNPAALLALMWYYATEGQGGRTMVILPYKDRLQLFSKYLQQLIMESLGKEKDLDNNTVHQGIAVFGNKGSTDQHSYVQQLLEGPKNFFITFIEVLKDHNSNSVFVEKDVTSGDYLSAFLQGTRRAMTEKGRESITLTIEKVNAFSIGVLIALYERAVGLYAFLININAYHQPAVEAGKKGAQLTIALQKEILNYLRKNNGQAFTAEEIALALGNEEEIETVFKVLEHVGANVDHGIKKKVDKIIFNNKYYFADTSD